MANFVKDAGRHLWRWSIGGLPGWLVNPGLRAQWSRSLRVDTLPLTDLAIRRGTAIDVVLGPDVYLKKELSLPIAAKNNLDRVIDLHVRQSLPGGASDSIWTYATGKAPKGAGTKTLPVQVYLLKKRVADAIRLTCEKKGAALRSISVADVPTERPFLTESRKTDGALLRWSVLGVASVLGVVGYAVWSFQQDLASLDAEIAALSAQKTHLATQAVELRNQFEAASADFDVISADLARFEAAYRPTAVLLDATDRLSDETWISDLNWFGSELRLSGFTGDEITGVVSTLREIANVQDVELEGPISFDSFTRKNRFDVLINLEAGHAALGGEK